MKLIILGGGLSALSLAYFLQDCEWIEEITILEREDAVGGLCRSIHKDGCVYDIGPHILFSKDKEMLELSVEMAGQTNRLRRSNQILHKGRYVQYPFENDLSKLPKADLDYCVTAFMNNPYEEYPAQNMLQFFLKTFGEGITNLYLRPYNEKIWKHDPCFMDTQMVERIPRPTDAEILRSASGETVDGYVHQLYFDYPRTGGIEAVVKGFENRLTDKCRILLNQRIRSVARQEGAGYLVKTAETEFPCGLLVSTIPVQELTAVYEGGQEKIGEQVKGLKYNSILVAFVKTQKNRSGDHFAFMTADKDILFHRISRMDFLGEAYQSNGATYMVEITYRQGDWIDRLSRSALEEQILSGLQRIHFIEGPEEAVFIDIIRRQYAYVLYDLDHMTNMRAVRDYYDREGIILNGRFGRFEYWNMDKVLRESTELAGRIRKGGGT